MGLSSTTRIINQEKRSAVALAIAYNTKPVFFLSIENNTNGTKKGSRFGKTNWGWFYLRQKQIMSQLPYGAEIEDSVQRRVGDSFFVSNVNGYIQIFKNGKILRTLDYGDFFIKSQHIKFDSLDYGLYHLVNDTLIMISSNGNDLINQDSGVYFVPLPGYDVFANYSKRKIFEAVHSVSNLQNPLRSLLIENYSDDRLKK